MLKIRLMRIGAKKKPFYRVVVLDERSKRTGAYIELLGTYNPLTEPKDIKLKQDRIDYWIGQGAQPSTGYLRIIGKAPQRPPRKPKKEKKEEPSATSHQPSTETETKTEDQKKEETSVEDAAKETESTQPVEEKTEPAAEEKASESEKKDERPA